MQDRTLDTIPLTIECQLENELKEIFKEHKQKNPSLLSKSIQNILSKNPTPPTRNPFHFRTKIFT